MAEFFQLSTAERLEALDSAANTSGILPHLLEKDIWVVWALRHLFAGPYAAHLVFKGGTSLSKAYRVIRRFSEDVDHCDTSVHLQGIDFPTTTPQVMRAERTFWEKATAIHVFCAQGEFRGGERFARHWHDVTRLDAAGFADAAIADVGLARAVADHKSIFFAEKNPRGEIIDYHAAVSGGLRLVPNDGALAKLANDYKQMVDDGLFLDDVEAFEALLERCRAVQQRANVKKSLPAPKK